jgi:hypothetical protein
MGALLDGRCVIGPLRTRSLGLGAACEVVYGACNCGAGLLLCLPIAAQAGSLHPGKVGHLAGGEKQAGWCGGGMVSVCVCDRRAGVVVVIFFCIVLLLLGSYICIAGCGGTDM